MKWEGEISLTLQANCVREWMTERERELVIWLDLERINFSKLYEIVNSGTHTQRNINSNANADFMN